MQQRAGRVATAQGKGAPINGDASLEAEADELGARAARGEPARVSGRTSASVGGGGAIQLKGKPPFERDLSLSTSYVSLRLYHEGKKYGQTVEDEKDANGFSVTNIQATARPPVAGLENQGQHKVAWVAIWKVLERLKGKAVLVADSTMDGIISDYGKTLPTDEPEITVAQNRSSPKSADTLISKAHRYLVARQADDASWPSDDPDQLAGKGERGLGAPLAKWQAFEGTADEKDDVAALFAESSKMNKLFDATGRDDKETADAAGKAYSELRLHNPTAFDFHVDAIDGFFQRRAPGALPASARTKLTGKGSGHGGKPYARPAGAKGAKGGTKPKKAKGKDGKHDSADGSAAD